MIVDKIKTSNITVSLEDLKPEMSTKKRNWKELTWHIDLLELSSTLENPFFFANKDKISSCLEYLNIYFLYFAKNCKLTMGGNTRKKENQKRKIGYWTSKSNGIFLVSKEHTTEIKLFVIHPICAQFNSGKLFLFLLSFHSGKTYFVASKKRKKENSNVWLKTFFFYVLANLFVGRAICKCRQQLINGKSQISKNAVLSPPTSILNNQPTNDSIRNVNEFLCSTHCDRVTMIIVFFF